MLYQTVEKWQFLPADCGLGHVITTAEATMGTAQAGIGVAAIGALMIVCAPAALTQSPASAPVSLWQAIEAIAPAKGKFTRESVESGLGAQLLAVIDGPDSQWFKGEKSLADGVHIKNIDLRNVGGPDMPGFLVLHLDTSRTCISAEQVRAHYANIGEPTYSHADMAEGARDRELEPAEIAYWDEQPWGKLAFIFLQPKLECLGAVAYHIKEEP